MAIHIMIGNRNFSRAIAAKCYNFHRILYIPFIFENKSYTGHNLESKVNGRHQEEDLVSGSHVILIEPENKIMGSDS